MYTNNQLETLRQIPIIYTTKQLGLFINQIKKEGTYYRIKDKAVNVVITTAKNKYIDNVSGKSGYGSISFLQDIANYTFSEAVEALQNLINNDYTPENIEVINISIPKPNPKNLQNIIQYLTQIRFIDPDLINYFIGKGSLYADDHNNCVFINDTKTFAFLHGTNITKKFMAVRGKIDFFTISNTDNPNQIFLFESIIDSLSFLTLYSSEKGLFISLNGSAMINKLNQLNLKQYDKVYCCFDRDSQGRIFDAKVILLAPDAVVLKPYYKDFNDDLTSKGY